MDIDIDPIAAIAGSAELIDIDTATCIVPCGITEPNSSVLVPVPVADIDSSVIAMPVAGSENVCVAAVCETDTLSCAPDDVRLSTLNWVRCDTDIPPATRSTAASQRAPAPTGTSGSGTAAC